MRTAAFAAYLALVALVVAWEAWLAPATPVPRAFWIGLKVLPLAAPLPWLWRSSAYAHVLVALLALIYFSDGIVIAYSALRIGDFSAALFGAIEIIAAVAVIVTASLYARLRFRNAPPRVAAETES